jgi:hypothetical protein
MSTAIVSISCGAANKNSFPWKWTDRTVLCRDHLCIKIYNKKNTWKEKLLSCENSIRSTGIL